MSRPSPVTWWGPWLSLPGPEGAELLRQDSGPSPGMAGWEGRVGEGASSHHPPNQHLLAVPGWGLPAGGTALALCCLRPRKVAGLVHVPPSFLVPENPQRILTPNAVNTSTHTNRSNSEIQKLRTRSSPHHPKTGPTSQTGASPEAGGRGSPRSLGLGPWPWARWPGLSAFHSTWQCWRRTQGTYCPGGSGAVSLMDARWAPWWQHTGASWAWP